MREVIFESTGPRFLFAEDGQLKQICTGDDSYQEHKRATSFLAPHVCLRPGRPEEGALDAIAELRRYQVVTSAPIEFSRLPTNDAGQAEAIFGYRQPKRCWQGRVISPCSVTEPKVLRTMQRIPGDIAAMLAYGNFAIRVRGQKLVETLAQFYEAIAAGQVVLAPGSHLMRGAGGVVLVNLDTLSADELGQLARDNADHQRRFSDY
jgi:hypothetical protein